MEALDVSKKINLKIKELEDMKQELVSVSQEKALSEALYEKVVAKTIISLKNGKSYELDGLSIENPPSTVLDRISRGICWREKLDMDKADMKYRTTIKLIDLIQAQLNGYQSINRYLSEI